MRAAWEIIKMKKSLVFLTMVLGLSFIGEAQITTYEEFKASSENLLIYKGKKMDQIDYEKTALALADFYPLDKHNAVSHSIVYNVPGKTKDQIYVEVNNWFIHSFNSGKSVIQLNDKDAGSIIGKGYVDALGSNLGFFNKSDAAAWVIIRVDIKEEKMRVIATIQSYEVTKTAGIIGALSGATPQAPKLVEYIPNECFPYTKKEKGTGSKALTLAHCWIATLFDNLNDAVNNGITGLEDEDGF